VLFATELIRAEFTRLRPALAEHFARNAEAYRQRLLSLKVWADQEITQLPPSRRLLFTSLDAFGYLARDYGFTVYAIHGLSTDGEPNAKHIARLIDLIREKKVKAIFAESSFNPRLITQLVAETEARLGGTLYADGLGAANSPASTYEALVRHNLSKIINALK
jgi:zinc/manganese transport system substrate-binding protein